MKTTIYDDLSNKKLARKVSRHPRFSNHYTAAQAEKLGRDQMIRLLLGKPLNQSPTRPKIAGAA